ncbi:hypothetical protein BGX23_000470 [Mortierella sp. AD031]|nr:hypothetical protein BGX23_000470 [Mortierella sp. AD031]
MSSNAPELQPTEAQDGRNTEADSVIRYSREFLMACAESPLVQRPEALPPTSEWFGEIVKEEPDLNNGIRKVASKTAMSDRIVLGPPKMSFASSSLGGMKRTDDGLSGFKKSLEASFLTRLSDTVFVHRVLRAQLAHEQCKTPREGRTPRGPPSVLEQGFGRETIEKLSSHKLPKVTPKDITGLLSGMERRRMDSPRNNSSLTGSRHSTGMSSSRMGGATSTRTTGQLMSSSTNPLLSNGNSGSGMGLASRSQRSDAPEWMSYDPDSAGTAKEGEDGAEQPAFVDDIQAWKARMKEHERREKEKELNQGQSRADPKAPSRADSSSSWRSSALGTQAGDDDKTIGDTKSTPTMDKPLGRSILSSEPIQDIDMFFSPGGIDLSKPFDASTAFDKFLSQHTLAASSAEDPLQQKPARKADGSRFARFFAEDEPEPPKEPEQPKPTSDMPGKQLSLDQLFQSHAPNSATASAPPPLGRMPSEAEILQSMKGAQSPIATKAEDRNEQSDDAFGFSKIMAALSKPPVSNPESLASLSPVNPRPAPQSFGQDGAASSPLAKLSAPPGLAATFQDPSIVSYQAKPTTLLDTLMTGSNGAVASSDTTQTISSPATSENFAAQAAAAPNTTSSAATTTTTATATATTTTTPTASTAPPAEAPRPASRPVQVAFGGGIPTSVYRQLSGKTDGQKSATPLIRPLNSANGASANGGGSSPSLSSPSVNSPRQYNAQVSQSTQQPHPPHQQTQQQLPPMQQQQSPSPQVPQQPLNKNFGPYSQGPGPILHSPVMDPRMGPMFPNGGPSPMGGHGHGMENDPQGFFHGMPMQRPPQGVPPLFGQQMPPFSQQMHVNGPGDFMPPHPSQMVGMPPFGAPMHPGMFPMNPVEMLMHRGPGGPPPPRPMPGMGPGPGPNHFVPNNFGHPMTGMPHHGLPMNPPFFPPQVSKPMMTREEFERRNRQ